MKNNITENINETSIMWTCHSWHKLIIKYKSAVIQGYHKKNNLICNQEKVILYMIYMLYFIDICMIMFEIRKTWWTCYKNDTIKTMLHILWILPSLENIYIKIYLLSRMVTLKNKQHLIMGKQCLILKICDFWTKISFLKKVYLWSCLNLSKQLPCIPFLQTSLSIWYNGSHTIINI